MFSQIMYFSKFSVPRSKKGLVSNTSKRLACFAPDAISTQQLPFPGDLSSVAMPREKTKKRTPAEPVVAERTSSVFVPRDESSSMDKKRKVSLKKQSSPSRSLSEFHRGIAGGWIASSSRLVTADYVAPSCSRLVWWRCAKCEHRFRRRVVDHVAVGGECEKCQYRPTPNQKYPVMKNPLSVRARPNEQLETIGKRSLASVADDTELMRARRTLQPMLAAPWLNFAHTIHKSEKLMFSPKLDGIRCIVAFSHKRQTPCFFSRSGMELQSCDHLVPHLMPLFKMDSTLVLDGELYNHSQLTDFQAIMSAVRTMRAQRTAAVQVLQEKLQLHFFDIMYARKLADSYFDERYSYLSRLIASIFPSPETSDAVQVVPAISMFINQADAKLQEATNAGYEGIMIRRCEKPYAFGKRSAYLLKYKKFHDSEFKIVGFTEGKGQCANTLGAFICNLEKGKQTFSVSPSVDRRQRQRLWNMRNQYVGKVLTVQFQELTRDGVPRFPVGKCIRGCMTGNDWL